MRIFKNLTIYSDAPQPWGVYLQDSARNDLHALIQLHDSIMFYLVIILFGVAWIIVSIIWNYVDTKYTIRNTDYKPWTLIELIWTITPALILILIAFPSFKLLYLMDEVTDPSLTVFVEGHQWYWSYQYPDFTNDVDKELEFDLYWVTESDLEEWRLSMLHGDNRVLFPELSYTRFTIPSEHVASFTYEVKSIPDTTYLMVEGSTNDGTAPDMPGEPSNGGTAPDMPGEPSNGGTAPDMPGEPSNGGTAPDMPGEPSEDGTDPVTPDLIESRAMGNWDSSTVPESISTSEGGAKEVNDYAKNRANDIKTIHDDRDRFMSDRLNNTNFITSQSGRLIPDYDSDDVREMAKAVQDSKTDPQGVYNSCHREINTSYAVVRDNINSDRVMELRSLNNIADNRGINMVEERQKILDKYAELDEDNLRENGRLKGELRFWVDREEVKLKGMDETNQESVELFEEELSSAERGESDNNSVSSLETHNPLDETSNQPENTPEGEASSKISKSDGKRPIKDLSEQKSSR